VAATSRPDKVDTALLRPGRLEQHLFVGPPTTEEDLFDLLSKLCLEWNLTDDCQEQLSSIENAKDILSLVIRGTGSIFPADIKAAFVTAHVNAVHRALEKQKPEEIQEVKICLDDLKSALQGARPSVSGKDALELKEIYQKFQGKKNQSNESSRTNLPELKTTLR
jgi:SpoVK/Ycf46/Vps4 family AAA+-type ATPase